jgi:hypothetical protein
MARQYQMAAQFPPISLLKPAADAAGRISSFRSLKNALKAWIVVHMDQGAPNTVPLSILEASAVAGSDGKALTNACPIWADQDVAAAPTLVSQAAGTTFSTSAAVKEKIVIFEIVPEAHMDLANGFDCIAISTGASSASNITEAMLYMWGAYEQATPPNAYVD